MRYISTRGLAPRLSFSDVVFAGLAEDGGLYVPEEYPVFSMQEWSRLRGKSYAEVAFSIMRPYMHETFDDPTLRAMIDRAYGGFSQPDNIAPLIQVGPEDWILELFHGPTLAFKDYAMQMLAQTFQGLLQQKKRALTIVGATSGDTGSAALHACRDIQGAQVFILHPHGRVSEVQRKQMTTVIAPHIHNIALQGTFDDCQAMVKRLFQDIEARNVWGLTAVNSINWARILPQVVYYAYAALALGAPERTVSFTVPTGNFGNMFACFVAQKMGLPLGRCVVASNRNNILTRFFQTGVMEARPVEASVSPSMDIQVSSNFERMLFEVQSRNATMVKNQMDSFKKTGEFSVDSGTIEGLREKFDAFDAMDDQTSEMISVMEQKTGYLCDPHTSVGCYAARQWRQSGGLGVMVALACAHPSKFGPVVQGATGRPVSIPERLKKTLQAPEKVNVLANNFEMVRDFIDSARRSPSASLS
jgi:threonine synthase